MFFLLKLQLPEGENDWPFAADERRHLILPSFFFPSHLILFSSFFLYNDLSSAIGLSSNKSKRSWDSGNLCPPLYFSRINKLSLVSRSFSVNYVFFEPET